MDPHRQNSIHTLYDINRNNPRPPPRRQIPPLPRDNDNNEESILSNVVTPQNILFAEEHRILFVSGKKNLKNPREQNYFNMIHSAICPVFECLSFTCFIILVDLALFITELALGLNKSESFLQVKSDTLIYLGGNYQPGVKSGQVYRLLAAIVLHFNFLHIFSNIIATFILVSRVQYTLRAWKTVVLYFLSGIAGNIFSVLCSPSGVKIGASTSLYGMIGFIIGYVVINWDGVDGIGPGMKCQLYCTVSMMIVFVIFFTPISGNVDYFGHLGGFLGGLWLAGIHQTIVKTTREKIFRIAFLSLFGVQILVCFLVFYLQ